MDISEYKFSIKRILKTSDSDYIKSLSIYNNTTPYEIKTPTNEITYWINNQGKNTPFEIYVFSLYINDNNIGFLMLTYIKRTKVIVYEYMAVLESFRNHTVFLTFENLFRNYLKEKNIDISYYITEMSNKNDGKDIDRESRIFEKMLCIEEYGKIDMLYYALPLGLENHESDFNAYLYITDVNNSLSMDINTYLDIVNSIYYDYWLNWYTKIMPTQDISIYRQKVNTFYNKISDAANKRNSIDIKRNNCSILNGEMGISHASIPIMNKKSKLMIWIILSIFVLCFPIVVIYIYNKILTNLGLSLGTEGTLVVSVFTSIVGAIAAIISSKKSS